MTDAPEHVLVLDEGTTSTRAIAFRRGDLESVAALRQAGVATPPDECLACISLPDGPVTIEA